MNMTKYDSIMIKCWQDGSNYLFRSALLSKKFKLSDSSVPLCPAGQMSLIKLTAAQRATFD